MISPKKSSSLEFSVVLEAGRETGFVALCPALSGCVSQGKTRSSALKNIGEGMEGYIEALMADGLPIPREQGRQMVEVRVSAA